MQHVHVLYEHNSDLRPYGCSYIRLILPLDYLAQHQALKVTWGPELMPGAQIVIVERAWKPAEVTVQKAIQLVEAIREMGASFIYAIDDNLLDLQPRSFAHLALTEDQRMVVRYLARQADGVIVSTAELGQRFARLNAHVQIVANALDERLFVTAPGLTRPLKPPRLVIGYMGTHTHDADLMLIAQSLRAALGRFPQAYEVQLVGGVADAAALQAFKHLPFRVLEVGDNGEYPKFVPWMSRHLQWDLAIAPLEDTPFTRCKSDLKFLDYSALGIPGIYSRVLPYETTIRHLETGYLADNTVAAWREAFEQLLVDDALRRRLASTARDYVLSQRTLQYCAHQWYAALVTLAKT